MQPGYYWAKRKTAWRIVQAFANLPDAMFDEGYAVPMDRYGEFVGPLTPPLSAGCTPAWMHPPVMRPEFHIDWE
jgi:hypothetical protein